MMIINSLKYYYLVSRYKKFSKKENIKIDLGAGRGRFNDHISIDLNKKADIVMDIGVTRSPFKDNSVDQIYSSHFLEHLEKDKAFFVLNDCFRILKKGGRLILILPDMKLFARNYVENNQDFYDKKRWPGKTIGEQFQYVLRGMGHKFMYDYMTINKILTDIGFKAYKPEYDPNLHKARDISLIIEAKK